MADAESAKMKYLGVWEKTTEYFDTTCDYELKSSDLEAGRIEAVDDAEGIVALLELGREEWDGHQCHTRRNIEMIVNETELKVIWYKGRRIYDFDGGRENG